MLERCARATSERGLGGERGSTAEPRSAATHRRARPTATRGVRSTCSRSPRDLARAAGERQLITEAIAAEVVCRRLSSFRQAGRAVLRPDLGAAQVRARQRPGRRAVLAVPHARRRLRSALRRAPRAAHGVARTSAMPTRAASRSRSRPGRCTSGSAVPRASSRIAQAVVFLACAPKSNAVYTAFGAAMEDAQGSRHRSRCRCTCAMRRRGLMKEPRLRQGLSLCARRAGRLRSGRDATFPDGMTPERYYRAGAARARDPDRRSARAAAQKSRRPGDEAHEWNDGHAR